MEGDISRDGSIGEFFFFLNRARQLQLGNVAAWNPGNATRFGVAGSDLADLGKAAYDKNNISKRSATSRKQANRAMPMP